MTTKTFKPTRQIGVGGLSLGPIEKKYLNEVIDSNRLSYGPFSKRFEARFAAEHDCNYAAFCNSGTSALHIGLQALKEIHGWADGDEVIVPAVTFVATANIVLHCNMRPVFVDVDCDTYNLDPRKIEVAISPRTRMLLPVHLFGLPADMGPIMDIAYSHGLKVMEDSCETMFATYRGKKVGSFGDIGCFSTYIAHLLATGVGGLATTNNPEIAVHLKSLMNHGRNAIYLEMDDDAGQDGEELYNTVAHRFSFVHVGHSFRCTELEAAIGVAHLDQKDEIVAPRAEHAATLSRLLGPLAKYLQLPITPQDREHKFMMYPLVLRHAKKTTLVNHLEQRLIETRDMLPLLNQPIYKNLFGDIEKDYPIAQWINRSGFYVGCHQHLRDEEVIYIAEAITEFFR